MEVLKKMPTRSGGPFIRMINDALANGESCYKAGDMEGAIANQEQLAVMLSAQLPKRPLVNPTRNMIVGGVEWRATKMHYLRCKPIIAKGVMDYIKAHGEGSILGVSNGNGGEEEE